MALFTKGDPEARSAQLLALDFNGTLCANAHWSPDGFGRLDVTVIRMAHQEGHVVYVLTAAPPRKVARSLRAEGIAAKADPFMLRARWNGGKDGKVVLVTQRKLQGTRMIGDDRAMNWNYGDNPLLIITAFDAVLARQPVI